MDDFVVNVRQIGQYPTVNDTTPADLVLMQQGGLGGPYVTISTETLVSRALARGGSLAMTDQQVIAWTGGGFIDSYGGSVSIGPTLSTQTLLAQAAVVNNDNVAGQTWVAERIAQARLGLDQAIADIGINSVRSFNGRIGNVTLQEWDINYALGLSPPDAVASQNWTESLVLNSLQRMYLTSPLVFDWNGRSGHVCLTLADITNVFYAPGNQPTAPTPNVNDKSDAIATTQFVNDAIHAYELFVIDLSAYALLDSPNFVGVPTAPTANTGTNTGQIATTAFVAAAVAASTAGVASFNTRTGNVVLTLADVTSAGAAPLASPGLTGTPTAPTATTGTDNTQIATTAFVHSVVAAVAAGVTSFNTRTGNVTLTTADVTGAGGAPAVSPALSGVPTTPTAATSDSSTQIASTAFVHAAIAALGTQVTSFNGRTGAVSLITNDISAAGGAVVNSPTFTGTPAAPTAAPGNNTTQLATTAFVTAAIAAGVGGVTSFNTRTGAVTLITADITGAGGAPIASPNFTGTPTAPTAAQTVNDTTIASTAYVRAAIAGQTLVSAFNGRTGAVSLTSGDVSAVGGALLASPSFTGVPLAPTAAPGTNTTQIATTAFVAANSVTSFNTRSGAITLQTTDITAAGGAVLASPAFTGTPTAPTPAPGTNNTQIATTAFVAAAAAAAGVTSFNSRTGAITLTSADITGAGGFLTTGGTIIGNVTIAGASSGLLVAPTSGGAAVNVAKSASGQNAVYYGYTGNRQRWAMIVGNSTPESGGNAGSDFQLLSVADDGATTIGTALLIIRKDMGVTLNRIAYQDTALNSVINPSTGHYFSFGAGPPGTMNVNYWTYTMAVDAGAAGLCVLPYSFNQPGQTWPWIASYMNAAATAGIVLSASTQNFQWAVTACDGRLKTNRQPCGDALACVTQVPVYTATYTPPGDYAEPEQWDYTLVADEVNEVLPFAYMPPIEDGYATLAPLHLIAVLWRAVQQLSERVAALEAAA